MSNTLPACHNRISFDNEPTPAEKAERRAAIVQAAEAARNMYKQVRAVMLVGDVLQEIGDLNNARDEAAKALEWTRAAVAEEKAKLASAQASRTAAEAKLAAVTAELTAAEAALDKINGELAAVRRRVVGE